MNIPFLPAGWLSVALGLLLSSTTASAETLYQLDDAGCAVSLKATGAHLQVRTGHDCEVSASRLQALLDKGLSLAAQRQDIAPHRAIFLGRLVHYPWLVNALVRAAAASPQWDATAGAAKDGHNNPLVAQLLEQSEALQGVRTSLQHAGYRITSVSVEKVLVGSHANVPQHLPATRKGKLPFDAQVWLMLAP